MKISRTKIILAAALALTGGFSARAQSNRIPSETDYTQFSQFVTDRNIFDPNRYSHTSNTRIPTRTRYRRPTAGAPEFTLVGTMAYEKGLFAFFDGNNYDLKKILAQNGEVAGYTVLEITLTSVKMQGPDKKEFAMKVGDQMRQESGRWQFFSQNELGGSGAAEARETTTTSAATAATATAAADNSTGTDQSPAVAPSPALESNDILKRLMEKRAKEDQ